MAMGRRRHRRGPRGIVGDVSLTVLGGAAAIVFIGLGIFRNPHHRVVGAAIVSVGVGLMVPGLPALLLHGVNSL